MIRLRLGLAGLLLLASCRTESPPDLTVRDAWARETVPGQKTAAVYLTIDNRGGSDRLTNAWSRAARSATLHSSWSDGGIARMRPMTGGLDLPAGERVVLKPGGGHIMLSGLGLVLRRGDSITMGLGFERSDERTIRVRIVDAASTGATEATHEGQ